MKGENVIRFIKVKMAWLYNQNGHLEGAEENCRSQSVKH